MEIIEPSVDVWGEIPLDLLSTLKWIERAGRTCYDSLDKIKPYSSDKFVANVLKPVPPHASVLEHSNLVLRSKSKSRDPVLQRARAKGMFNSNFIFTGIQNDYVFLYGNWRAFYEEDKDLNFFDFPEAADAYYPGYELVTNPEDVPYFAQAATICFKTSRAQTHEMVRHRPCAFSQRSQRYCSESNLQIIKPVWYDNASIFARRVFNDSCKDSESCYRMLIKNGLKKQEARVVLPNATATTIVMSAYLSEWDWIFYLRNSPAADPPIRKLMNEAKLQMITQGIIDPE